MKKGQPVEEAEAEEGGVNRRAGPCLWHAMWPEKVGDRK